MLVDTEVVVVVVSSLVVLSAVSVMVETLFELGTVQQRAVVGLVCEKYQIG